MSEEELERMINPCCNIDNNYTFHKNNNGFVELIEVFQKTKKIIERDDDEDESQIKISIDLEYDDVYIIKYSKSSINDLLRFNRHPIVVDDDDDDEIKKNDFFI